MAPDSGARYESAASFARRPAIDDGLELLSEKACLGFKIAGNFLAPDARCDHGRSSGTIPRRRWP